MDVHKIPPGANPPDEIHVLIEIPEGGVPVKYELDKVSGAMFVNRFLHTAMYYPANYGFIPNTLSQDGDPCDAMVLSQGSGRAGRGDSMPPGGSAPNGGRARDR
jgi:inorganic pyrophosphatase